MKTNLKLAQKHGELAGKYLNLIQVTGWKLGLGKFFNCFPALFGKTMVLDFSRREAKAPAQLPLVYYPQGDVLYCTAFGSVQPDWYLSVIANPQVEVWLPDGWYTGKAELVEDEEERAEILSKLIQNGGASASVWKKINWVDMDEDMGAELPLLRIKRQSPCTGAEGPGSLAWLWPFFFFLFLFRPRRRRK
jgi:hypothetical protein